MTLLMDHQDQQTPFQKKKFQVKGAGTLQKNKFQVKNVGPVSEEGGWNPARRRPGKNGWSSSRRRNYM